MLFPEEDEPFLKRWIIKRLEKSSDADADVLADYVLALLKHQGDVASVRQLCEVEVPVFVNEDPTLFIRDIFNAIEAKSYLPGAPPPPPRRASVPPTAPTGPAGSAYNNLSTPNLGPLHGSRKRSYHDQNEDSSNDRVPQIGGDLNGRAFKQPRRGNQGLGRGNFDASGNNRRGRGGFPTSRPTPLPPPDMGPQSFSSMPSMPSPPPGMPPFDPLNPMATMLAMQAMGFAGPVQPPFSQSQSPGNSSSAAFPFGSRPARRQASCRDYDEKGYCGRGDTCMFEHGGHSVWAPTPKADEYDPNNSSLMTGVENNGGPNHTPNSILTRGRGRGRGDRGGINGTRRGGRSEISSDRPNLDKSKSTIVVENIPEDKFNESDIRSFFSDFGQVVEVSMRPYKRLSIIKFADWDGAHAAYKSPKVIFDNRFVKVYWHSDQESIPHPPANVTKTALGIDNTVLARAATESHIDIEEFARKQADVQRSHEEKMKRKLEMEAARKELEKRQEDLFRSQAEEKKKLLDRIAAKSRKVCGSASGSINGDLVPGEGKPISQTEALKAQLALLEAEAKSLGIDTSLPDDTSTYPPRGGYRGRISYRARGGPNPRGHRGGYRGRGGAPSTVGGSVLRLDNRPKTVALSGVDFTSPDKEESLRQYLLGIGEYTKLDIMPTKTIIHFRERYIAEKFVQGTPGSEIPSVGKVDMSWVQTPLPPMNLAGSKPTPIPNLQQQKLEEKFEPTEDVQMPDEGDAMATGGVSAARGLEREAHEHIDYDVADDEWS